MVCSQGVNMDGSEFSGSNYHYGSGSIVQVGNARDVVFGDSINVRKQFMTWLPSLDFREDYKLILKKRYKSTGAWIIEKEEFSRWAHGIGSCLLWCWGPPGIGKSVISSVVLSSIKESIKGVKNTAVAYAYFKYDAQDQQWPVAIIASFIKQLCRNSELSNSLLNFWQEHVNNVEEPHLDDYISQFQCLLKDVGKVFLVIDALDECRKDYRRNILDFLIIILKNYNNVKIFVTSRKEEDIEDAFDTQGSSVIQLGAQNVSGDIYAFVHGRVGEWAERRRSVMSQELQDLVISTLVQKAEGMSVEPLCSSNENKVDHIKRFLWVDLQLRMLQDCKREKDIKNELEKLHPGLDSTYQRIINQIGQQDARLQDLVQRTLAWVFYAKTPLTTKQLMEAVAIDKSCRTWWDLEEELYSEDHVFTACANLLTEEFSFVRPIHYSVREYFTRPSDDNQSIVIRSLSDAGLQNAYLAECCIWYLMLDHLADGPCFEDDVLVERIDENPFVLHAAYYFDHYILQVAKPQIKLKECLDRLLASEEQALASILQIRNLRGVEFDPYDSGFLVPENTSAEEFIFTTALHGSPQLLSINDRWKDIQPPRFALHLAAKRGASDLILRLVELGMSITEQDASGVTPLYYASEEGHAGACSQLIQRHADVNAQGGFYGNALQAASARGHQAVIKVLLSEGVEINAQGGKYDTALQAASLKGHQSIVEMLLTEGADANAPAASYGTPLQIASAGGYQGIVEILLTRGANINAEGPFDDTALHRASAGGYQTIVEILLTHGADINVQGGEYGNALQAASAGGYQGIVEILLTRGANINCEGGQYGNALQAALAERHQAIVEILLTHGADINAQGGKYGNALQVASARGHLTIVDFLLTKGVDVNAQGGKYGNALQAASAKGHLAIVDILLIHGADINVQGGEYGNALQAASAEGHLAIVDILLTKGADINAQGGKFCNALQAAWINGQPSIVDILLTKGALIGPLKRLR